MIKPTEKVPALNLDLINGTRWELEKQSPAHYSVLVFYRGLHCPKCKEQLESLKDHLEDFNERGINVVAISMDTEKRAKITGEKWYIESIPVSLWIN